MALTLNNGATDLSQLMPSVFLQSPLLTDYMTAISNLMQTVMTDISGLYALVNPYTCPTQYLQNLADLVGLQLRTSSYLPSNSQQTQLINVVAWYKIKGTYASINYLALLLGLNIQIQDFWCDNQTDYNNGIFSAEPYFVDVTGSSFPSNLTSSYFPTPHFGIYILLNQVYGTFPSQYLWNDTPFPDLLYFEEQTRPVHTVPHFFLQLSPQANESGGVTKVAGNIYSSVDNWIYSTNFYDNTATQFLTASFSSGNQWGCSANTPIVPGTVKLYTNSGQLLAVDNNDPLLTDGAFAIWNSNTALKFWTLVGTSATLLQVTSPVHGSTFSAEVSSHSASGASLTQNVLNYGLLQSTTVTFSAWVRASVPNQTFIEISDSVSNGTSQFHPGDGQWHLLTVTYTVAASITFLKFSLVASANTSGINAFFDSAVANGNNATTGSWTTLVSGFTVTGSINYTTTGLIDVNITPSQGVAPYITYQQGLYDAGMTYDNSYLTFLQSITTWKIGNGNVNATNPPTGGIANPLVSGTGVTLQQYNGYNTFTVTLPLSTSKSGLTEFGLFTSSGTLVFASYFPSILLTGNEALNIVVQINQQ